MPGKISKLIGKDVAFDFERPSQGSKRVAENDQKNDDPFSVDFWQLDIRHARVPGKTIRTTEASKISLIVYSCDLGNRKSSFIHQVEF